MERAIANINRLQVVPQPQDEDQAPPRPLDHQPNRYDYKRAANQAIEAEIAELEERRVKLKRLDELQKEVSELESRTATGGTEDDFILNAISRSVCKFYNIGFRLIKCRAKDGYLIEPRHMIWWLARKYTSLTYHEIGRRFDRDHGAVMHGKTSIDNAMNAEPARSARLREVEDAVLKELLHLNIENGIIPTRKV